MGEILLDEFNGVYDSVLYFVLISFVLSFGLCWRSLE